MELRFFHIVFLDTCRLNPDTTLVHEGELWPISLDVTRMLLSHKTVCSSCLLLSFSAWLCKKFRGLQRLWLSYIAVLEMISTCASQKTISSPSCCRSTGPRGMERVVDFRLQLQNSHFFPRNPRFEALSYGNKNESLDREFLNQTQLVAQPALTLTKI